MKRFMRCLLGYLVVLCNLMPLYAMEAPVGQHVFLKSIISDIQNEARILSQDTDFAYRIVITPALLEKCLETLGLDYNSTPLDVRYHYELMIKKLSPNDALYNVIARAYHQLIVMLSVIDDYKPEIDHLLEMSFEDLQAMELAGKDKSVHYQFLKHKDRLIDATIAVLENKRRQYIVSSQVGSQFGLPVVLQTILNVSADTAPYLVDRHYNSYMQKNDMNKLIALERMKKIPTQTLKDKLIEVERVKEAYAAYVKERK